MAIITHVIDSQQGEYSWGRKDCLTTASQVLRARGESAPDYSSWHSMSEAKAIQLAVKKFGNLYRAHIHTFKSVGLLKKDRNFPMTGDILILGGVVIDRSSESSWDTEKKCELLGFVVECGEVWSWFKFGLVPVEYHIIKGII